MTVHLVLGGARSGKSRFAEQTALATTDRLFYIATAQARDHEMAERVHLHRSQRDERFTTVESPWQLPTTLADHQGAGHTLVVDCLTLWLSNWLTGGQPDSWPEQRANLLDGLEDVRGRVILVSNEVGQGIVPLGEISRRFVDEAGRLHQDIARLADRVTFITAGLPQRIK